MKLLKIERMRNIISLIIGLQVINFRIAHHAPRFTELGRTLISMKLFVSKSYGL